jgi:hypothetical protein
VDKEPRDYPVELKSFVHLEGAGRDITSIVWDGNGPALSMQGSTEIRHLSVASSREFTAQGIAHANGVARIVDVAVTADSAIGGAAGVLSVGGLTLLDVSIRATSQSPSNGATALGAGETGGPVSVHRSTLISEGPGAIAITSSGNPVTVGNSELRSTGLGLFGFATGFVGGGGFVISGSTIRYRLRGLGSADHRRRSTHAECDTGHNHPRPWGER